MKPNKEKQEIIKHDGNALIIANPGTGKTLLLAFKYVDLIKKGLKPEEILCLTFTNKARAEMENRIIKILNDEKVEIDLGKLQVFTFHSFALDNIDNDNIISSNLLRYSIYDYLKQNEVLNYGDEYLINTIVPKIESLIRYLKSFGVMPDSIDLQDSKTFLEDFKNYSKEELEQFLEEFVKIFQHYETIKANKGFDYNDLLIKFLELDNVKKFKYVLVDELQDVNKLEADIALKSCENFVAVGDQKQAIFGFQGGSILNFEKFNNSKEFVLTENFRSSNEILNFAKEDFSKKTKEEQYIKALENLENKTAEKGPKPVIFDVQDNQNQAIRALTQKLLKNSNQVAVIARTNNQIREISKEFEKHNIEHSSTYFSASNEAKNNIITFLRGIFSNNIEFVKNAMFTSFFPISLHEAFELSSNYNLTLNDIFAKSSEFKQLRESISSIEDINLLFKEKIIPVALTYGEEYLLAAQNVQSSCNEAISLLENKDLANFTAYLESADLFANESDIEQKIILTTIHKAKGKEFETVIFAPSKSSNSASFQDAVVEAILKSKKINAEEELEEETLRSNFVAFTRAKKNLYILTGKPADFLNDFSEKQELQFETESPESFNELQKRAFNLFVNKQFKEARQELENSKPWLKDFVKKHFAGVNRLSYSALPKSSYDYFVNRILKIQTIPFKASTLGSDVHNAAEKILKNQKFEKTKETEPFIKNVQMFIKEIKKTYPNVEEVETTITLSISKIVDTKDEINFTGKIDSVFSNGEEYLIVDWKTDKSADYSSNHRQQLELYKRMLSQSKNIPLDKIKVAIGYIGLRKRINDGTISSKLDDRQPSQSAFTTASTKINQFLQWKNNPETFLEDLIENKKDEVLWRSMVEQVEK